MYVGKLVKGTPVESDDASHGNVLSDNYAQVSREMPSSTVSDLDLLDAIRHDDEDAFAELFRRHWKRVHDMAISRVRSQEITAEIVQDLFISLWDKRASHSIRNLSSYFHTAVKNKALNYIESQMVRKNYRDYYRKYFAAWDNETERTVAFDDLMGAIEVAMKQLPEKTRTVFQLNKLEGWSVPEIAERLHLSEKSIGYHLTQSLKKLRFHLKDYFIALVLTALVVILGK